MNAFMPNTVIVAGRDERSNGHGASFVFHMLYSFAPTGHDPNTDPPTLPTGTVPTGEWHAYLLLADDRREIVRGWGLMQSDIEAVLRAWLRECGRLRD